MALEKCVLVELTSVPDKLYSIDELFELMNNKHPHLFVKKHALNKHMFTKLFFSMEDKYNNVYTIVHNGIDYIVWSTNSKDDIIRTNQMESSVYERDPFMKFEDYIGIIENALEFNDNNFDPNELLDDNMNAFHFLIFYGEIKLLKRLINMYDFDMDRKTGDNHTVFDLVYKNGDMDMLEYLVSLRYDTMISEYRQTIQSHKIMLRKEKEDKTHKLSKKNFYLSLLLFYGCIISVANIALLSECVM